MNSENINLIIRLLEDYLSEYRELKNKYEECEIKKQLFEQLELFFQQDFQYLNENKLFVTALLDAIYKDSAYDDLFYNSLRQVEVTNDMSSLTRFLKYVRVDKEENLKNGEIIKRQIDNRKSKVKKIKSDILSLKKGRPLMYNYNIKQILSYYETKGVISSKELILLNNELQYYNGSLTDKSVEYEIKKKRYEEIPNILNSGFELIQVDIHPKRRTVLNNNVDKIINMINCIETTDELIELFNVNKDFYRDLNEFKYVINEVIKYYLDNILDYYELLLDSSIYQNAVVVEDAKEEYFKYLKFYLTSRQYFNDLDEEYNIENENVNVEEDVSEEEVKEQKVLVFSHSSVDPLKSKLIADLKAIEPEKYEELYDLLERFIQGKTTRDEFKGLHAKENVRKGFSELRGDQVRIVLKHLKDNIYCVMGAFIKKASRDTKNYNEQRARVVTDISTKENEIREIELGKKTMEEVGRIVEENSRKGSR